MDFLLSDDQRTLVESVRDFLSGTHGPEVLRALDADPRHRSDDVARQLRDMGLPGLLVPEAQGGLGLKLLDAALIAVELGRANLSEPLIDSAFVAAPLLARAGGHDDILAGIIAGDVRVALAHPANPWIADLDGATHLLSVDGGRLSFGKAPAAEVIETVDPLRILHRPVRVTGQAIAGSPDDLLDIAALMAAAQALGAAEAMLALATAYAGTRQQFGQPIGAFQAVKHALATVMVATEFARPVLWRAAQAFDDGLPTAPVHVSHAKLAATDAAILAAETAIQVHGAMGYTYEVDLHFWMKRSWALAGAWGSRGFHLARVDAATIGGGMAIGPSVTFA